MQPLHYPIQRGAAERNSRHAVAHPALTLIELLVVIAVIAVLATLLIPTVGGIRSRAQAGHCTANMRQIGAALLMYTSANGNTLPGPVSSGQSTIYTISQEGLISQNGGLAEALQPYLEEPARPAGTWSAKAFLCPGWVQQKRNDGVNTGGNFVAGQAYQADQVYMGRSGDTGWGPLAISAIENPAATWALREADKMSTYAGKGNDNGGRLASNPAHASFRNNLYYDGHVEALPLDRE